MAQPNANACVTCVSALNSCKGSFYTDQVYCGFVLGLLEYSRWSDMCSTEIGA